MTEIIMASVLMLLDALRQAQGGKLTEAQLKQLRERTQTKVDRANAAAAKALGET